jgi:hypothetical protein
MKIPQIDYDSVKHGSAHLSSRVSPHLTLFRTVKKEKTSKYFGRAYIQHRRRGSQAAQNWK